MLVGRQFCSLISFASICKTPCVIGVFHESNLSWRNYGIHERYDYHEGRLNRRRRRNPLGGPFLEPSEEGREEGPRGQIPGVNGGIKTYSNRRALSTISVVHENGGRWWFSPPGVTERTHPLDEIRKARGTRPAPVRRGRRARALSLVFWASICP